MLDFEEINYFGFEPEGILQQKGITKRMIWMLIQNWNKDKCASKLEGYKFETKKEEIEGQL